MPSKVFLDPPFPENLPVVEACGECNQSFSADEEFTACLIEAEVSGGTDPAKIRRPSVARILARAPKLRTKIGTARRELNGGTWTQSDSSRVRNVVLKLARGHAAFELSLPCREEPTSVRIAPLHDMTPEERSEFEEAHFPHLLPEIGSRAMLRIVAVQPLVPFADAGPGTSFLMQDWVDVQESRYAYLATDDGSEIRVRMLIGGFLACDVRWET